MMVLIKRTCECYLISWVFAEWLNHKSEMRKLYWIIWMGSKCHRKYLFKRDAKGDSIQKHTGESTMKTDQWDIWRWWPFPRPIPASCFYLFIFYFFPIYFYYLGANYLQYRSGFEDWTEVSTSQEMLGATGNRVKEEIFLEETLEGAQSWEHLDFSRVILISDFSNSKRRCFCCLKPPGLR